MVNKKKCIKREMREKRYRGREVKQIEMKMFYLQKLFVN